MASPLNAKFRIIAILGAIMVAGWVGYTITVTSGDIEITVRLENIEESGWAGLKGTLHIEITNNGEHRVSFQDVVVTLINTETQKLIYEQEIYQLERDEDGVKVELRPSESIEFDLDWEVPEVPYEVTGRIQGIYIKDGFNEYPFDESRTEKLPF